MSKPVFRDFADTFLTLRVGRPRKTPLETFGDFGGLGMWRLLYMGIAIATLACSSHVLVTRRLIQVDSCGHGVLVRGAKMSGIAKPPVKTRSLVTGALVPPLGCFRAP